MTNALIPFNAIDASLAIESDPHIILMRLDDYAIDDAIPSDPLIPIFDACIRTDSDIDDFYDAMTTRFEILLAF